MIARDPVQIRQWQYQTAEILSFAVFTRRIGIILFHHRRKPAHGCVAVYFSARDLVGKQKRRKIEAVVMRRRSAGVHF